MKRILNCNVVVMVIFMFTLLSATSVVSSSSSSPSPPQPPPSNNKNKKPSLQQSSSKTETNDDASSSSSSTTTSTISSQYYWNKIFQEIKNSRTKPVATEDEEEGKKKKIQLNFSQWKPQPQQQQQQQQDSTNGSGSSSSSSSSRPAIQRFDGFATWDRILQGWSEDVQDYLKNNNNKATTTATPIQEDDELSETTSSEPMTTTSTTTTAKDEATTTTATTTTTIVPAPRKDNEEVVPYTDLSDKSKNVWIVTTASLPWMTGTAVNPLLRAAYLCNGRKQAGGSVTLMLPWLEREDDQQRVYGKDKAFNTTTEQEDYVRTWLRETAFMPQASEELQIRWYTAWQNRAENSIYSMGDITALIDAKDVDVMILEEPEHLNWYRAPGESWTTKFRHVVGIIHTNYFIYAQEQPAAFIRAPGMKQLCIWMCRSHCHRVIKLSGALQQFAPEKELIENVHGVRNAFLETGHSVKKLLRKEKEHEVFGPNAPPTVYFIGKMLWSKGLGPLMELLKYAEETAGLRLKVDMYGGGPDQTAAQTRSEKMNLNMIFHGPIDHAKLSFTHKVFINPSTSEVLCTTVSEALAMGKFVVLPSHPSNDFFAQFPNCLTYSSKEEFVGNLYYALTHSPEPLAEEYLYALSWEAATQRLEAAGCIPVKEAELMAEQDNVEITLPSLIEGEQSKKLSTTIQQSRERYRLFRSKLSQDIRQTNVLPKSLQDRLVAELDKRLDLDIDKILESPKLRLDISPAELDKQLLDLYKVIASGPSGDFLRIIGGGNEVSMQVLYMKRQERKRKMLQESSTTTTTIREDEEEDLTLPEVIDYLSEEGTEQQTASQLVKWALRRNLPRQSLSTTALKASTEEEAEAVELATSNGSTEPVAELPTSSSPPPPPPSMHKKNNDKKNKQLHQRDTPTMSTQLPKTHSFSMNKFQSSSTSNFVGGGTWSRFNAPSSSAAFTMKSTSMVPHQPRPYRRSLTMTLLI